MPLSLLAVLAVSACVPGAGAARVTGETARGAGRHQLAAGQQLRSRFVLIERLEAVQELQEQGEQTGKEGGDPVPGKNFPKVGKLASYGKGLFRSLTFRDPEHLGMGSFGDAWRAYDNERKEYVVLKIFFYRLFGEYKYLTGRTRDGSQEVEEAEKECLEIQRLFSVPGADTDPGARHICRCYENHTTTTDAEDVDEPAFLVLEDCGQSLKHYEQATFKKPWSWRKRVVEGILEAVRFLSQQNLIHHDLKPDNVCVTDAGEAKLIDFGAMQVWPNKTDPCLSTAGYSAPEWTGRCFDATAPSSAYDSYATGIILLELLCGKGSFDISNPESPCTSWLSFGIDANAVQTAKELTNSNASLRPSPTRALSLLRGL